MSKVSFAVGENLKTSQPNQILVGVNNEMPIRQASIIVGNGNETRESTSFLVLNDGTILTYGDIAVDSYELAYSLKDLGWEEDCEV